MSWIDTATRDDFARARRKAFLSRLLAFLRHQPNELLPFSEVRARLNVRGQQDCGMQTVPLARIVGSEGRYSDFDRGFLPLRQKTRDRWLSVDRAHYQDVGLPAVELYQIGDIYFVKDGNHRVSVARQQGQVDIDAHVIRLLVDVPISDTLSVRDLLIKEEYSDFLDWTNLATLRPDQRIEFSEPGGYLELIRHINTHRYFLGLNDQREIARDEAVQSWYDTVYLPLVAAIREKDILQAFPGRTEADLYRWIMEHRWYLSERNNGADPGPQVAAADYAELFGRKTLLQLTERLARAVFQRCPEDRAAAAK